MAKKFLNVGNAVDALALLIECEDIIGVTPINDEIMTLAKINKYKGHCHFMLLDENAKI